jgi:hypothetical protein
MLDNEIGFVDLICRNQDCMNFEIAIPFENPSKNVICGACGTWITTNEEPA